MVGGAATRRAVDDSTVLDGAVDGSTVLDGAATLPVEIGDALAGGPVDRPTVVGVVEVVVDEEVVEEEVVVAGTAVGPGAVAATGPSVTSLQA